MVTKSNRDSQMDDPEIVEFNVGGNIAATTDENLRYLNNFLFSRETPFGDVLARGEQDK